MSDKMRVLVTDSVSDQATNILQSNPELEIVVDHTISAEDLKSQIKNYQGIVIRSRTTISKEIIEAAEGNLKVIGRAGVGVDNIDRQAATDNGVVVMNTPTGNTISTAEHAFSLMLSLARNIPQAHASIKAGRWDRKLYKGVEINGKRLAIIGMGRIGAEFAKRAQAFGMSVAAFDPFLSESRAQLLKVDLCATPEEALTGADVVTLHTPLLDSTRHLMNSERLKLMNKGAMVINCARGGLVHEQDISDAIKAGHIGGYGMDVFEVEPPVPENPLLQFDKEVVYTPHLGASTKEAQELVGLQIAEQVRDFLIDGSITNAVNMPSLDTKTLEEVGKYLPLAESLGSLLYQIGPNQADELTISYTGPVSDVDYSIISRTATKSYLAAAHNEGQVNLVNAPAIAKAAGISVSDKASADPSDYTEQITVSAKKGDIVFEISGTYVGSQPRIVNINGKQVESAIAGNFLIIQNDDRSGIVGGITSILGQKSFNIANMALSRNKKAGDALSIIQLDSIPCDDVIKEITTVPGVLSVEKIAL